MGARHPAEAVLWDGLADLTAIPAQSSATVSANPIDGLSELFPTTVPSDVPIFAASLQPSSSSIGPQSMFPSVTGSIPGTSSFSTVSSTTSGSPTTHSAGATPYLDFLQPTHLTAANNTPPPADLPGADRKRKQDRERNTEAARRYRKRRVDETDELRAALAAMTKERDELKLKLVRAEAESSLLRKLHVPSSSKLDS